MQEYLRKISSQKCYVFECDVQNPHKLKRGIAFYISEYDNYWTEYFVSRKSKKPIRDVLTLVAPPKGSYWCDAVKLTKQVQ